MSKSQSSTPQDYIKQVKVFVSKTHYFVLFTIIGGVTLMAVISVSNMLNQPISSPDPTTTTQTTNTADFSKDPTLEKIQKLEFSTETTIVDLPTDQRINPFSE